MAKKTIGVIGATGYAGLELVRILAKHPNVELKKLCSMSFEGQKLSQVYPSLQNIIDDELTNFDEVVSSCDVIFACMPHGHSEEYAIKASKLGKLFIDLGADFRLESNEEYKNWYDKEFIDSNLHKSAVYSIPELNTESILGKKLIANPGCYPTSVALGLFPALINKLVDTKSIIIDSKSGATGAGRGLALNTHFTELNDCFSAYKVASHRHTPEIEQTLSSIAGEKINVTFTPHLLPVNRGILSTIYCYLQKDISIKEIHNLYKQAYQGKQFIRILPLGEYNNIKFIKYSNYCDIALHLDERTNRLIIISTIDNMVKGAAGQAVQNMNLCLGFEESTGIDFVPPAF